MNDAMKEDIMCQVCMQQDGMPGSRFCKPNLEVREIDIDKCPIRIEVARRFLEVLKAECIGGNEEADSKANPPIGLLGAQIDIDLTGKTKGKQDE